MMTTPEIEPAVKTIAELVANPDFPKSAVGETVDINGFTGVITDVVKNSIKVRSADGTVMSYNYNALRRLHAPRALVEEMSAPVIEEAEAEKEPQPKRDVILTPDFDSPMVPIEQIVEDLDFPKKAFGLYIDLHGYSGVVVELVGRSLKVRSPEGSTRSYNADGLRKIYQGRIPSSSRSQG
jgi:hypothetical protein